MPQSGCFGCAYYRKIGSSQKDSACHYCHDTGNPRGCPSDRCDKRITRAEHRITFNQYKYIRG